MMDASGRRIETHDQWPLPSRKPRVDANEVEMSGWFTPTMAWFLGHFSETLELVASPPDASASRHKLQIDEAYRRLGVAVRQPDLKSGRNRIIWAVASTTGDLYVGLSEMPVSGTAYVARFRPDTGDLVEVLQAALPQIEARRSMPHNPGGTIAAGMGTYSGRLILADAEAQIIAIY